MSFGRVDKSGVAVVVVVLIGRIIEIVWTCMGSGCRVRVCSRGLIVFRYQTDDTSNQEDRHLEAV